MKLTNLEVKAVATPSRGGKQNEGGDDRETRMKAFWSDKTNSVLYPIGTLLKAQVSGHTLAHFLAEGQEIEMDSLTASNGVKLPLQTGFKLSLKSMALWGCPACRSAHGSGVYPSREVDEFLLGENQFYYNPATRALFVISETCWKKYVKKAGVPDSTFKEVPIPKTTAPAKAVA